MHQPKGKTLILFSRSSRFEFCFGMGRTLMPALGRLPWSFPYFFLRPLLHDNIDGNWQPSLRSSEDGRLLLLCLSFLAGIPLHPGDDAGYRPAFSRFNWIPCPPPLETFFLFFWPQIFLVEDTSVPLLLFLFWPLTPLLNNLFCLRFSPPEAPFFSAAVVAWTLP